MSLPHFLFGNSDARPWAVPEVKPPEKLFFGTNLGATFWHYELIELDFLSTFSLVLGCIDPVFFNYTIISPYFDR